MAQTEQNEPQKQMHQAIVVLGMHRSGTSAITRILNLLGMYLSDGLMSPAQENNETGFWEHKEIVALNDEILSVLDSCWDDVSLIPAEKWRVEGIAHLKTRAIEILERDFGKCDFWGVKDPRLCRLMPFWHTVFDHVGVDARYVIVARHPLEVAASLSARDCFPIPKSCLLWLHHMLASEMETRGCARAFVTYDQLLSDWEHLVGRVWEDAGLRHPLDVGAHRLAVEDYLSPSLRHHSWKRLDNVLCEDRVTLLAVRVWHLFMAVAARGEDASTPQRFDVIRTDFERVYGEISPYLDSMRERVYTLLAEIADARRRNDFLAGEVAVAREHIDGLVEEIRRAGEANDELFEYKKLVDSLRKKVLFRAFFRNHVIG